MEIKSKTEQEVINGYNLLVDRFQALPNMNEDKVEYEFEDWGFNIWLHGGIVYSSTIKADWKVNRQKARDMARQIASENGCIPFSEKGIPATYSY